MPAVTEADVFEAAQALLDKATSFAKTQGSGRIESSSGTATIALATVIADKYDVMTAVGALSIAEYEMQHDRTKRFERGDP